MFEIYKLKQIILAVFLMFGSSLLHAQNEANNWVFGVGAGISFDPTFPHPVTPIGSAMNQAEGVATMSDAAGNLLFYTNGESIWDATHTAVVTTGLFGHQSATQSSIIVPDPASTTEYYIFTVGVFGGADGLQYVKYDASLGILIGTSTLLQTTVTEKVTAVKKGDDSGYWVLAHDWGNNDFFVYEIDCDGITLNSTQSVGAPHQGHINSTLGYMKFNSDGDRIAVANTYGNYVGVGAPNVANSYGFVQVFDFDNLTGVISGTGITSIGYDPIGMGDDGVTLLTPYGLEFSRNSDFLYISEVGRTSSPTAGNLFQYDFAAGTTTSIGTANGGTYDIGALQMGRDGKIYVAIDQSSYLGVIDDPEITIAPGSINFGLALNQQALLAGDQVRLGLPNFVQSIFEESEIAISGNECSPTFSYTGTGSIASYLWDFGDGNMSTAASPTHTYAVPGSYTVTLTITTVAGCITVHTASITAEDCCPILGGATDVVYHTINETITTDTYWSGTHYVEDGVIITVIGAALDITNVDVIFGECAGIDFMENSTARINNSVLRPCDMEKTWRGLHFFPGDLDKPKATINESTFKNAQTGIYFIGTVGTKEQLLDMTITNNLFLNNQMAIYLRNTNFNEHITGNTVTVENIELFDETLCSGLTASTRRYGVYFWNVAATGKVAQNDFVCTRTSALLELYGVSVGNSSALITENNFSNNETAFSARFGSNVKVENNEIGISANHTVSSHQISIHDCDMVTVKGNQLNNSNELNQDIVSGSQSAIAVVNNSNSVWIKENEIRGFETGIHLDRSNQVVVAENSIENSWFYGVYMNSSNGRGSDILVSCNTINMLNVPESDVTGIGFYQTGTSNHRVKIYSNCIFETNQSIHIENTVAGVLNPIPDIKNNFLYNYTRAGIENIGMLGDIGTSGVNHTTAGRNSFISNNAPNQNGTTTGDIISNTAIVQNGNYGVGLFTATVTGNANAASFHSTSSCGGQNRWGNNYSNEIDAVEICDELGVSLINQFEEVDGEIRFKSELYPEINDLGRAVLILRYLNGLNPAGLEQTYNSIITESTLFESDHAVLEYTYYMLSRQYEDASALGETIDLSTISTKDLAVLENVLNDISWNELSADEQGELVTGVDPAMVPTHIYGADVFSSDELELNIYPNPSQGEINVQLNTIAENPIVKIYDFNGRLIEEYNLTTRNTLLQMSVSHLASGLYYVIVENEGIVTQGKFSKN